MFTSYGQVRGISQRQGACPTPEEYTIQDVSVEYPDFATVVLCVNSGWGGVHYFVAALAMGKTSGLSQGVRVSGQRPEGGLYLQGTELHSKGD